MVGGLMHVMIDLETMSTQPDAAVCSIGAVLFDPELPGEGIRPETFYRRGLLSSSVLHGGQMEPETVLWWMQRDDAARAELWAEPSSLVRALTDLRDWMQPHNVTDVWGNGADFDLVILSGAYLRARLTRPWTYHQQRCLRERRQAHRRLKLPGDGEAQHHALHDAVWGARMAVHILREEARRDELAHHAANVARQAAMSAPMSGADIAGGAA